MSPHAVSLAEIGSSLAERPQNQVKIDGVFSNDASLFASKSFYVLHMAPMSDIMMCNQLLVAHLCHTMLCFGLQLREKFGTVPPKSRQN